MSCFIIIIDNLLTPTQHTHIYAHAYSIVTVAKAPASKQALKFWDANLKEIRKVKQPHNNIVNGVVFSPKDDDKFFTYSGDCSIKQWFFSKGYSGERIFLTYLNILCQYHGRRE